MSRKSRTNTMSTAQIMDLLSRQMKQYQSLPRQHASQKDEQRRREALGEAKWLCKELIRDLNIRKVLDDHYPVIEEKVSETVTSYFRTRKLGETKYLSANSLKSIMSRYTGQEGVLNANSLRRICFPTKSAR